MYLKFKKSGISKYGKLPAKLAEVEPWVQVDVDLIVLYSVTTNRLDVKGLSIEITLTGMTFIDPSTGKFKILEVPSIDKSSAPVSQIFN